MSISIDIQKFFIFCDKCFIFPILLYTQNNLHDIVQLRMRSKSTEHALSRGKRPRVLEEHRIIKTLCNKSICHFQTCSDASHAGNFRLFLISLFYQLTESFVLDINLAFRIKYSKVLYYNCKRIRIPLFRIYCACLGLQIKLFVRPIRKQQVQFKR